MDKPMWFTTGFRDVLNKKVIDTSTLSQNNLRRFNGADVFEHIFYLYRMESNWKRLDGGQVSVYRQYPFKASANKNEKHNKKYKVQVSQYIDMLTQDVVKIRKKERSR